MGNLIEERLYPGTKVEDVPWLANAGPTVIDMFIDPAVMINPYPLYARLLAERPEVTLLSTHRQLVSDTDD